jgi:hypothetical protein
MLFKGSYKILIISAMVLKIMAKRTRYKKSVRQLYSGDESLSNLDTLCHNIIEIIWEM